MPDDHDPKKPSPEVPWGGVDSRGGKPEDLGVPTLQHPADLRGARPKPDEAEWFDTPTAKRSVKPEGAASPPEEKPQGPQWTTWGEDLRRVETLSNDLFGAQRVPSAMNAISVPEERGVGGAAKRAVDRMADGARRARLAVGEGARETAGRWRRLSNRARLIIACSAGGAILALIALVAAVALRTPPAVARVAATPSDRAEAPSQADLARLVAEASKGPRSARSRKAATSSEVRFTLKGEAECGPDGEARCLRYRYTSGATEGDLLVRGDPRSGKWARMADSKRRSR